MVIITKVPDRESYLGFFLKFNKKIEYIIFYMEGMVKYSFKVKGNDWVTYGREEIA